MHNIPTTINCRGKILDVSEPRIMGILNITNDSFYDGGKYLSKDKFQKKVAQMVRDGVDIIDIGGMSSRPGSIPVDISLENDRVSKAIEWVKDVWSEAIISIDTFREEVAHNAFEDGAHMLNDISAFGLNERLLELIDGRNIPYVLMHMQGTPAIMQSNPSYENVVEEVLKFLIDKISVLLKYSISDIIIDPGFGFGKTIEHNYTILENLHVLQIIEKPILVGLSRKSMIYKVLESGPEAALNGSTALHMIALERGAKILRVHDVKEAHQGIKLWQQLKNNKYAK